MLTRVKSFLFKVHTNSTKSVFLSLLIILLSGCTGTRNCNLSYVCIKPNAQMNESMSTTVDLVLIYDVDLLKKLQNMPNNEYFSSVKKIYSDWYKKILIYRWEPCPGQKKLYFRINKIKKHPVGAVIFTLYSTTAPDDVSNYTKVMLTLTETKTQVSSIKNSVSTKNIKNPLRRV
jgi:hypothetical protein